VSHGEQGGMTAPDTIEAVARGGLTHNEQRDLWAAINSFAASSGVRRQTAVVAVETAVLSILSARLRALRPAAQGWVTVTDDPATWAGGDAKATCLVDCTCGQYPIRRGAWTAVCFGDECATGKHRGCRWHEWPSSAPAAPPVDVEALARKCITATSLARMAGAPEEDCVFDVAAVLRAALERKED